MGTRFLSAVTWLISWAEFYSLLRWSFFPDCLSFQGGLDAGSVICWSGNPISTIFSLVVDGLHFYCWLHTQFDNVTFHGSELLLACLFIASSGKMGWIWKGSLLSHCLVLPPPFSVYWFICFSCLAYAMFPASSRLVHTDEEAYSIAPNVAVSRI